MLINEIIQTSQQLYLLTPMLGEDAVATTSNTSPSVWSAIGWEEIT